MYMYMTCIYVVSGMGNITCTVRMYMFSCTIILLYSVVFLPFSLAERVSDILQYIPVSVHLYIMNLYALCTHYTVLYIHY